MKSWVLAAGLLAVVFVPAANAADVGEDRQGTYNPRDRAPPPAYNDRDDDDDDGPPPAARKYSGPSHNGQGCVRSEQVRDRLSGMGWQDFHGGAPQGDLVTLRARRPSGRLFELTLQRCSGEIVEARPLEPRPYGPYAFNRGPRDFDGPYAYGNRWREDNYAYRDRRWWNRGY